MGYVSRFCSAGAALIASASLVFIDEAAFAQVGGAASGSSQIAQTSPAQQTTQTQVAEPQTTDRTSVGSRGAEQVNREVVNQSERLNDIFVVCQREKEVRWIRVFRTDSGSRCQALYSKEGFAQSVSSGQNFNSCKSVLENIRKNIEEGGFKCRDANLAALVEVNP